MKEGFAQRGLAPLHPRERTIRRDRRQKQFAITALAGYLTFRVFGVVAEQTGPSWLAVPALLGIVLAVVGAVGLVWSMAWRFGDEKPA